jgi:hydroxybutyrate-dimer hydrolase
MRKLRITYLGLPLAVLSCGPSLDTTAYNDKPAFLGAVTTVTYDGATDDLLTAGLGKTGLAGAAPVVSATPTAAELRRLAIYTNYRAVLDITAKGGYGTFYGPNVAADGTVGSGEGKVAGSEYIAYADGGAGAENVTLMVQVPASFDKTRPCIVTGVPSGSRGVYGAIGTSGEWSLKHRCAVAYADKGGGNGAHDLQANTINRIDGTRTDAATAGKASSFTAGLTAQQLAVFNTASPNRFAFKHAHSGQNPERNWGRDTLRAAQFGFWAVNEQFGDKVDGRPIKTFTPENTLVIASGISNGAGAALAAAEQDTDGLIDGVAVSEPNVQMAPQTGVPIVRGSNPAYTAGSRPLYDYVGYANLLQPCAALADAAAGAPAGLSGATATAAEVRCAALARDGWVTGTTTKARANEALSRLLAYGWEPESALLHASHYLLATPGIVTTYSNAYGRFSVADNLCGFSFGAVTSSGSPAPADASLASIFGTGSGIPPTAGIQIINNLSAGGPVSQMLAISPSTGMADLSYDGAYCQRNLWTGASVDANRVKSGVAETYRTANLRGKPAIIVQGRSDTLIPPNFSARPYYAQSVGSQGTASKLRYVEVTNAQHFDAFLPIAGFDTRFVPLHVYYIRAMDALWAYLTAGTALPASQVVRTTPRGGTDGAAPALTAANVPPIAAVAGSGDAITLGNNRLLIPE